MDNQPFTITQMKTAKGILGMVETGVFGGDSKTTEVLKDHAGITYGKHQTTENGGGLWKLLFTYYLSRGDLPALIKVPEHGRIDVRAFLTPYKDVIYKKGSDGVGRKGAVTNDEKLKAVLAWLGENDPAMQRAQDLMFHMEYFRPALGICSDYDVTLALGLLIIYDMCIHSGDRYAATLIERFNEQWKEPEEFADLEDATEEQQKKLEQAWVGDLIKSRHQWLLSFTSRDKAKQKEARATAYRTASYLKLLEEERFDLALPFLYVMDGRPHGYKWCHKVEITAALVEDIK